MRKCEKCGHEQKDEGAIDRARVEVLTEFVFDVAEILGLERTASTSRVLERAREVMLLTVCPECLGRQDVDAMLTKPQEVDPRDITLYEGATGSSVDVTSSSVVDSQGLSGATGTMGCPTGPFGATGPPGDEEEGPLSVSRHLEMLEHLVPGDVFTDASDAQRPGIYMKMPPVSTKAGGQMKNVMCVGTGIPEWWTPFTPVEVLRLADDLHKDLLILEGKTHEQEQGDGVAAGDRVSEEGDGGDGGEA